MLLTDLPDKSISQNKIYNIVKDYPWTFSPNRNEDDIPIIRLVEYEQDECTLWAQINYWKKIFVDGSEARSDNPYFSLYHAKPTKTEFILPYFETYDHQINQNWEKTKGIQDFSVAETVINLLSIWSKFAKQTPGTSINQPQIWSGSGGASYNINFTLFNTIKTLNTLEDTIKRNYDFRHRILMSSLHNQQTLMLITPPALFTVEIPGVRISPAAVISQISINNIGQINRIELPIIDSSESPEGPPAPKMVNVPDAWEFNIQITELISESRQILDASHKQNLEPVRAFNIES